MLFVDLARQSRGVSTPSRHTRSSAEPGPATAVKPSKRNAPFIIRSTSLPRTAKQNRISALAELPTNLNWRRHIGLALGPRTKSYHTLGQKLRFDLGPATSALPRSTDIIRPVRLVRFVPRREVRGPQSSARSCRRVRKSFQIRHVCQSPLTSLSRSVRIIP